MSKNLFATIVEKLFTNLNNSKLPPILKNKIALVIITALIFFAIVFIFSGVTGDNENILTYKVKRGNFLVSIIESGEIKAKQSNVISAPRVRGQLKITYMITEGSYVKPGDLILKFDPSEANTKLFQAQSQLDLSLSEKRKLLANQKSSIAKMESTLKSAKLNFELSKLNLTQMRFEAEAAQKKAQLQFQKDSLSYIQTLQDYKSQKIIRQSELDKMEIEIQQKRSELKKAQKDLNLLSITAPTEGLIVYENNWSTGQKFAVGDQPWRGQSVMTLPDLSLMQSRTYVNEVDVSKIKKGQQVIVTLDAFQDTSFVGTISEIARLGKKKNKNSNIKVFDITVDIQGKSELLKPGMTTGNKIIINEIPDTIFIPQEAVFERENKHFVFVKNGSSFDEREVIVGSKSEDYIIIAKGLTPGEVVALSDPTSEDEKANNQISVSAAGK